MVTKKPHITSESAVLSGLSCTGVVYFDSEQYAAENGSGKLAFIPVPATSLAHSAPESSAR